MGLVIDANILFSALIKAGKTEELVFEPEISLYAPEFIFAEFEKYELLILEKTNRSHEEFIAVLESIKKKIRIMPNTETAKYLNLAKKYCPDEFDIDYFALALKLHCSIWSNDKELKKQENVKIVNTVELLKMMEQ